MKNLILITATYFAFTEATPPSFAAIPAPTNASLLVPTSSDMATAPPPPNPGEPAGQWIDQLFVDTNSTSYNMSDTLGSSFSYLNITRNAAAASEPAAKRRKRDYEEEYGLHESTWANDTANIAYNISVDFSNCSTGLRYSTDVGVYTFTNGTTSNETTLKDMVADLWTLRHSTKTLNTRFANHTAMVAQLAMDEANAVLNNGLICKNSTSSVVTTALQPTDEIIHDELRHLLANPYSYWASVVLSAGTGAAAGAGIAAGLDYRFKGNVTAQNTIQTGTVVAVTIIIAGILNRMHEVGHLDNAQPIAQAAAAGARELVPQNVRQLVPAGREVVVQQVWLGWIRRAMLRMKQQQEALEERQEAMEEALSEAGVSIPGGSTRTSVEYPGGGRSSLGGESAGTQDPGTVEDLEACLDNVGAAEAATAVGEMKDPVLNLETINEVQEQLAKRNDDGSCGV
ncbi:hypothetical protein OEA41_009070 [Lepraria neglecta]|uniref:Uncharacterized protein n=1 Tax=Lepraria neglecta TaxID=209136 RepID=A0AAD9Z2I7_9LECA|nr:hypothetical protein OEA41_009070 [Lepraria neglecta]